MVKRRGGSRRKTRYKLQRAAGDKGKLRLTAKLTQYATGDTVALVIDPSTHGGMFFPRHHGKTGKVVGEQGRAYLVEFMDKGKQKTAVATAAHLKRV